MYICTFVSGNDPNSVHVRYTGGWFGDLQFYFLIADSVCTDLVPSALCVLCIR